jgi:50S ribosomal protein L16 3-hydroxylase
MQLLGGLSLRRFLAEYWQKRPLLIRGALPNFSDPLSPEELAGLACEPEVTARLVLERDGETHWALRHGPFTNQDFLSLPETHWTLLVQDVEKHLPERCADLLESFRFIPDWRIADLMISYAPSHGSVGPHVDTYDVFLLQGMGQRCWRINTQSSTDDDLLPNTELRILRDFNPEQEWVLSGGDMLYLPPGIAHHGVACEPCLTYSIGFRAPTCRDLVGGFADFLTATIDPALRYTDPDLLPQDNPGEITAAVLTRVKQLLHQHLDLASDDALIAEWFGRYITESEPPFEASPEDPPRRAPELMAHLRRGGRLVHHPGSRFAFIVQDNKTTLFIDGRPFSLDIKTAFLAPLLCRQRVLTWDALREPIQQDPSRRFLLELLNAGYLEIDEHC